MTAPNATERRCPDCNGRGYHTCECWPGDCICGFGDQECENCGGTGWLYPDEYDDLNETIPGLEGEA